MAGAEATETPGIGRGVAGGAADRWISLTLRAGVAIAALLVLVGLVRFVAGAPPGGEPQTVDDVLVAESHATSLGAILAGVAAGRPTSLIRLGILVLVLTPAARVALTLGLFLRQRDWFFVAVTALVLAVLLLGLTGVGV